MPSTRTCSYARDAAATLCVLVALATFGCSIFTRPKPIDMTTAQHAVDETTRQVTAELERRVKLDGGKRPTVCFLGVMGDSATELSISTRSALDTSDSFRLLEKSVVQNALKESGVRANNIFIPAERKKFVEAVGEPVDYLIAGYVEYADPKEEEDGKSARASRVYRLELVNAETNVKSEFSAEL